MDNSSQSTTPETPTPSDLNTDETRGSEEAPVMPAIPTAKKASFVSGTKTSNWPSKTWLLAIAAVALSAFLVQWSLSSRGQRITIRFHNGHGIQPESKVMFRGIEVGAVEALKLNDDLSTVQVIVRLTPNSRPIACEGSLFWIERPVIDFHHVRGLETIVGGRYIGVAPGPDPQKWQTEFIGIESPHAPPSDDNGLEILIESNARNGLREGAPITYRGFTVGRILTVSLSTDSRWVQCRALIDEPYRDLLRESSQFWNQSGFQIEMGLTGLDIEADSLESIVSGGIAFSTPDPPGDAVRTGFRFELAEKPDPAWLAWRPRLVHGESLLQHLDSIPIPTRVSLNWKERFLGFTRTKKRSGWATLLTNGQLLLPSDLIERPASAIGDLQLEIAGREVAIESTSLQSNTPDSPTLPRAVLWKSPIETDALARWNPTKLANLDLSKPIPPIAIVTGNGSQVIPVEHHHVSITQDRIHLSPLSNSLPISTGLHVLTLLAVQ